MEIHVMNSAMMPEDAIYKRTIISEEEFKTLVTNATTIHSSIGYEEVSKHIKKVTGVYIPVNRGITKLSSNLGTILVVRLKFRPEAYLKGKIKAKKDDYEYIKVEYLKDIDMTKFQIDEGATNDLAAFGVSEDRKEIMQKVVDNLSVNSLKSSSDILRVLRVLRPAHNLTSNEVAYIVFEVHKIRNLKEDLIDSIREPVTEMLQMLGKKDNQSGGNLSGYDLLNNDEEDDE